MQNKLASSLLWLTRSLKTYVLVFPLFFLPKALPWYMARLWLFIGLCVMFDDLSAKFSCNLLAMKNSARWLLVFVIEYRNDDVIKIYFYNFYILTMWSERAP